MFSEDDDGVCRDENVAVYNWMTNCDLYTIKLLMSHDVVSHEDFTRMLKEYFSENEERLSAAFTFEIVDIIIDYADIELINMLLHTLLLSGTREEDKRAKYMHRLVDLGGTMPMDTRTLMKLPHEIIEEYVDFESLEPENLLQFLCNRHFSDTIKQKCCDTLERHSAVMPVEKIFPNFFESVNFGCTTENMFYILKYVHQQPDFEWIIIDVIRQTSELAKRMIKLFPENYVTDEIISLIIIVACQKSGFTHRIMDTIHPDVAKYRDVPLATYFGRTEAKKYTYTYYTKTPPLSLVCQDNEAICTYASLIQLISIRITYDKNLFEQKKIDILRYANTLLAALENDLDLQSQISS